MMIKQKGNTVYFQLKQIKRISNRLGMLICEFDLRLGQFSLLVAETEKGGIKYKMSCVYCIVTKITW